MSLCVLCIHVDRCVYGQQQHCAKQQCVLIQPNEKQYEGGMDGTLWQYATIQPKCCKGTQQCAAMQPECSTDVQQCAAIVSGCSSVLQCNQSVVQTCSSVLQYSRSAVKDTAAVLLRHAAVCCEMQPECCKVTHQGAVIQL